MTAFFFRSLNCSSAFEFKKEKNDAKAEINLDMNQINYLEVFEENQPKEQDDLGQYLKKGTCNNATKSLWL